jgi:two-component SAPR family response regulator
VSKLEVFKDVEGMISMMADFPVEICIIRLGHTSIQGLRAAEKVKEICPDTKIVFISDGGEYALDAYDVGAYGYMISPIEKQKFEKFMREVV